MRIHNLVYEIIPFSKVLFYCILPVMALFQEFGVVGSSGAWRNKKTNNNMMKTKGFVEHGWEYTF